MAFNVLNRYPGMGLPYHYLYPVEPGNETWETTPINLIKGEIVGGRKQLGPVWPWMKQLESFRYQTGFAAPDFYWWRKERK